MFSEVLTALTADLLLFAAVIVAFGQVSRWTDRLRPINRQLLVGAVLGSAALLAMAMPAEVGPGRYVDARGVILALSAPFGGWPAMLVTAVMTGAFRVWLGGAVLAQGLTSIVLYALAGYVVHLSVQQRGRRVDFKDLLVLAAAAMAINLALRFVFDTGATRFVEVGLPVLLTLGGGILMLGALLIEEGQRHALVARLRESERQYENMAANLPGVVYRRVLSSAGELRYDYMSAGASGLFGISAERITGDAGLLLAIMHAGDREDFLASLQRSAAAQTPWELDYRILHGGSERWIRARATPRRAADGGTVWDGVAIDVTDQKVAQNELRGTNLRLQEEIAQRQAAERERDHMIEELRRLSDTDPLTGVLNRRGFLKVAQRELKRLRRYGRPLALIALDLDHFKRVNDRFGHDAGDMLLKRAAQICQATVREVDYVARLGGEEFILLLHDADDSAAWQVAMRIRGEFERAEVQVEGGIVKATASLGIAVATPGEESIAQLMRRADEALYRAKATGRNRVVRASQPDGAPDEQNEQREDAAHDASGGTSAAS
jgi:diguanylate cyclase (GGDEF)-like protein/PAS domain S-box-containing protein